MFVEAIQNAVQFTRPIHSLSRMYGSTVVHPGAATLFFVNADGWALTCAHVARHLLAAEQLSTQYQAFKAEASQLATSKKKRHLIKALERKYNYTSDSVIQVLNRFVNCVDGTLTINIELHPSVDVALLRFTGYTRLLCQAFPTFVANGAHLKQGQFLCRLGFPFPEFSNFEYDASTDAARWTNTGRADTPTFPIEGMVTRHLLGPQGGTIGFEMSTPGLKGQSGGPVFDREGRVWGMQAATAHLDLDFDVDVEVTRQGRKRRVKDSAFLHVGHCAHVDVLKQFMRDKNVGFAEA